MGSIDIIKPLSTALSSAVNKSRQNQEKILGNAENQTGGCWVGRKYATSVLCSPPPNSKAVFSSQQLPQLCICWLISNKSLKAFAPFLSIWCSHLCEATTPSWLPRQADREYSILRSSGGAILLCVSCVKPRFLLGFLLFKRS